nr:ribonuclease H-like domain-containing protein [Tanacetum cinerariifolium]
MTRFCVRTNRPTERLNLHVSLVSPLLKSYRDAFSDPNWKNAMRDEYHALNKKQNLKLNGTLSRYKARLVVNGGTQLEGVDVDETFSLVVKPGTIRNVLSGTISPDTETYDHGVNRIRVWVNQGILDYSRLVNEVGTKMGKQKNYAVEILDRAHIVNCNSSWTPIDTESKLGSDGDPVSNPTMYQSLADADEASCSTTRRLTSGYCVFLGNNLLSCSSKHQLMLSRSSAKEEYNGVANAVAKTCWLHNLLRELYTPLSFTTLVYYNNVSVVYLSCNPVQHQRTKHIGIDIHFVHDLVAAGEVRVLHVLSRY